MARKIANPIATSLQQLQLQKLCKPIRLHRRDELLLLQIAYLLH
jgi:hypothetical protein